uniref:Ig-like domain-containing protein n=1 Tax=Anabas testudineus TaxID=64144 RepID=A0A3Q1J4J2_ANATE
MMELISVHVKLIICSCKLWSFSTGASDSKHVDQTPRFMMKRTGESVDSEISCSHSITNYDVILWYKQDKHKGLKLLGYLNLIHPYPEKDVEGRINFNGDGSKQSGLNISRLTLEDSGVYFCAASQHSAADSSQLNTKTFICQTDKTVHAAKHLQSASI